LRIHQQDSLVPKRLLLGQRAQQAQLAQQTQEAVVTQPAHHQSTPVTITPTATVKERPLTKHHNPKNTKTNTIKMEKLTSLSVFSIFISRFFPYCFSK
jgi:hypothetical protein